MHAPWQRAMEQQRHPPGMRMHAAPKRLAGAPVPALPHRQLDPQRWHSGLWDCGAAGHTWCMHACMHTCPTHGDPIGGGGGGGGGVGSWADVYVDDVLVIPQLQPARQSKRTLLNTRTCSATQVGQAV